MVNEFNLKQLQEMIDASSNIVLLGGAGTSTDCGLPDFRGTNGLYSKPDKERFSKKPEYYLGHSCWLNEPELFYDYYREKMIFDYAKPNEFHKKLVELEEAGKLRAIITQNIDSLHQKAGSKNVIEIHGSSARNYCMKCAKSYDEQYMKNSTGVPMCECGGIIKPDVVLYGETPHDMYRASQEIAEADMLIVAGTSLTVYPAAGLTEYYTGERLVVINNQKTSQDWGADLVMRDNLTEVFKEIIVNK